MTCLILHDDNSPKAHSNRTKLGWDFYVKHPVEPLADVELPSLPPFFPLTPPPPTFFLFCFDGKRFYVLLSNPFFFTQPAVSPKKGRVGCLGEGG